MAEQTKLTAKIETKGDAYVLTAGFKLETIKNLVKYGMDDALVLVDEKTKDEQFRVAAGNIADVSRFGVTFTGAANLLGLAELTGVFPKPSMSEEEKKNFLRDSFAHTIGYLDAIQKQIEAKAAELDKLIKTVDNAITIG